MDLGNKILELRKESKMSQEQLAEKLNITRQTISNWELNETTPDLKQSRELSKIFNISLDELVNNNIKDILVEKVSNTEKLAGIVIKILKWIGIAFLVMLIIDVIAFILFAFVRRQPGGSKVKSETLSCSIEDNDYSITIGSDGYFNCSNCNKKMQVQLNDITDWANMDNSVINVKKYFRENGGSCEVE